MEECFIESLPNETKIAIASSLDDDSLEALSKTDSNFKEIVNEVYRKKIAKLIDQPNVDYITLYRYLTCKKYYMVRRYEELTEIINNKFYTDYEKVREDLFVIFINRLEPHDLFYYHNIFPGRDIYSGEEIPLSDLDNIIINFLIQNSKELTFEQIKNGLDKASPLAFDYIYSAFCKTLSGWNKIEVNSYVQYEIGEC